MNFFQEFCIPVCIHGLCYTVYAQIITNVLQDSHGKFQQSWINSNILFHRLIENIILFKFFEDLLLSFMYKCSDNNMKSTIYFIFLNLHKNPSLIKLYV